MKKIKKIKDIKVKCNRCKTEREYPVYMKGRDILYPSYCSNCGIKLNSHKA